MIKQNKPKFEVRRSSCQGYMVPPHARSEDPSLQSRRTRGPSSPSSNTRLNASCKYSISNANHTLINDNNYTFNVFKYSSHDNCKEEKNNGKSKEEKGFYGNDQDNYNIYGDIGKYTCDNENEYISRGGEIRKCDDKKDAAEEGGSFTFSSAADSMEFFNFICTSEADACMQLPHNLCPSMSPADELFQDGKIRPLIQPIINGHNRFQHPRIPPSTPPSINVHNIQPSKPLLEQHASFHEFAAHYLASANHSVIKQELHAEKLDNPQDFLHQHELDHGRSSEVNQNFLHQAEPEDGLSGEINKKLKDQREFEPNYGGSPTLQIVNLSAAATSPVKEIILDNEHNDDHGAGSNQFYAVVSTSQVSCFKTCGSSLSRVFQFEDDEQILEVQDMVEDGAINGALSMQINHKRKTLQDLLSQEASKPEMRREPYDRSKEKQLGLGINPNGNARSLYDMSKEKQLGLGISPNGNARSLYDLAERRPSLAPPPINNIPHLSWAVMREKKLHKAAPSPHELHYASQKAHAHRLKKKTFLPYRPGLLACLGYPPL